MKVSNKKIISVGLVGMSALVLSCCKTTDKKSVKNIDTEENSVREISNTNFANNNVNIPPEKIESFSMKDEHTVPERINAVYKDMIQDVKMLETTYSASYTLQKTSSLPFTWMESLIDDGKYFYAIGTSKISNGRSTAKKFAELNAEENLRKAASKFTGDNNIDVRGWELFEVCYKKGETKKGSTCYTATVLIGIDRNLIVKN